jgi:hypothetical protein
MGQAELRVGLRMRIAIAAVRRVKVGDDRAAELLPQHPLQDAGAAGRIDVKQRKLRGAEDPRPVPSAAVAVARFVDMQRGLLRNLAAQLVVRFL